MTIFGNLELAVVTVCGVEAHDQFGFLAQGHREAEVFMGFSEKTSIHVSGCVQFGCKWTVWYLGPMFSITDEEKRKRRHSKMGRAQEMSEIRVQGSSEKASTHHQIWGERFLLTPQLPLI